MFNRIMPLALTSILILSLAGCGGGEEKAPAQSTPAAEPAPPKAAEQPVELYELTKDDITSHKDWTSRNITILGAKLGDRTRDIEKNFGNVENTRTLAEDYLTIYQGNGLFVYTFKLTGKARKFEVYDVFAKKIADANLKKVLTSGDLKLMRQVFGQEEGVVENKEDNATEYSYDSRGFRFVKFKVPGRTLNAIRFSELKRSTT